MRRKPGAPAVILRDAAILSPIKFRSRCQPGYCTRAMGIDTDQQHTVGEPERLAAARDANREVITSLLERAQHEILVFGPVLDGYYFNTRRAGDALGRFIANHRENRAHILVEHGRQIIRDNARMIALARRFADAVQIRRVGKDHAGLRELIVVIDNRACLYQEDTDRVYRLLHDQGPRQAALLARRFRTMWDQGEPLAEINAAGL